MSGPCPDRVLAVARRARTLGGMPTTFDDDDLDELRAILVEELASLHELGREVEAGLASRLAGSRAGSRPSASRERRRGPRAVWAI